MTTTSPAGDTAPDQVARLLALVPYLLARGEVRLDEAASHFGTDSAQIERDLHVLFMTGVSPGLPGDLIEVDMEALQGERIIRVANADYLARPVRFSPSEATALLVALRTMLDTAPPDATPVIERALAKLEAAVGGEANAPQMHVHAQRRQGSEIVPILDAAIEGEHQVEIVYQSAHRDEEATRVVDPRAVASVEDVLYLDAWCHRAQADRVFRVERILSARELDVAVLDPTTRPRDLTAGWFSDTETTLVTLRLDPPARWMIEYHPVENVRSGPGDTVDVDLRVSSEIWLRQLVFRLAPHAHVVSPTGLHEQFVEIARAALDTYERS